KWAGQIDGSKRKEAGNFRLLFFLAELDTPVRALLDTAGLRCTQYPGSSCARYRSVFRREP
ncbi:hypothetical protein, partial [Mesorhizobium sp. M7A.F.Ca.MR.148.00.0.0]|uniref:hypothetical protein n=1 Tax=Mesorhizobium sp. M7A.F.Ca.MR.148.00.0.0 TaxID=2496775 RepID=UPI0019CFD3D4